MIGQWLSALATLPPLADVLLKMTSILAIGWIMNFSLLRRNPRWRVVLWRGIAIGVLAAPLIALVLPIVKITLPQKPAAPVQAIAPVSPIEPEPQFVTDMQDLPQLPQTIPPTPHKQKLFTLDPINQHPWISLTVLWAFISAALAWRLFRGLLRVRRLIKTSQPAPAPVCGILAHVAGALGCRREMQLLISPRAPAPFLCGFRTPVIILPPHMAAPAYRTELPAILAHELAHLRTNDVWWMSALQCLQALCWFHPLVWRISAAHAAACEEVSDAVAAGYVGDPLFYSGTLARVALELTASPAMAGGIPMARLPEIRRRLNQLSRKINANPLARRWVAAAIVCGLGCVLLIGGIKFVFAEANSLPDQKFNFQNDTGWRWFIKPFGADFDTYSSKEKDVVIKINRKRILGDGRPVYDFYFAHKISKNQELRPVIFENGQRFLPKVTDNGSTDTDIADMISMKSYSLEKAQVPSLRNAYLGIEEREIKISSATIENKTSKTDISGIKSENWDSSGPSAIVDGRKVQLIPAHATFEIPQSWLDAHDRFHNNFHLTRAEIEAAYEGANEWDTEYAFIVNALLPYEQCSVHLGGEGWGREGASYNDVQMRAYILNTTNAEVIRKVVEDGPKLAAQLSHCRGKISAAQSKMEAWNRAKLSFELWFGDYGGMTNVDVFAQSFAKQTAVLVFMYSNYPNQSEQIAIDIVKSFQWQQGRNNSASNTSTSGSRTIHFPTDKPMGAISAVKPDKNNSGDQDREWIFSGKAISEIAIPAGGDAVLTIDKEADVRLPQLASLNPDDIQELNVSTTKLTEADTTVIAHLQGLKSLSLNPWGNGYPWQVKKEAMPNPAPLIIAGGALKNLQKLSSLEKLDSLMTLADEDFALLGKLPRLKSLTVTEISDAALADLHGFYSLEKLSLTTSWPDADAHVTEAGLRELKKLPKLKSLALPRQTTNQGLAALGPLPTLEELALVATQIDDEGLANLKQFPNLRSLRIHTSQPTIKGPGLEQLRGLPRLEEVDLKIYELDDAGLSRLKGLKSITKLNLSESNITDAGLVTLEGLENLHTLVLLRTITDKGFASVKGLKNLRSLTITSNISDQGLAHIRALVNLTTLNVFSQSVTDAGLVNLEPLHALRDLTLIGSKITDEVMRYVEQMPELKTLSLIGTKVTDAGVARLKNLASLKGLGLQSTQIGEASLVQFAQMPGLQWISLSESDRVTSEAVSRLKLALPQTQINFSRLPQEQKLAATAPADAQTASGSRVIHFPKDKSLGWLSIFRPGDKTPSQSRAAQGEISVPAEGVVSLQTTTHSLSQLASVLNDDDLQELALTGAGITAGELAPLAEVHGLKRLSFRGVQRIYAWQATPVSQDKQAGQSPFAINTGVLKALQGLPNLQQIGIYAPFPVEELKYLSALPSLTELDLVDSNITDATCKDLEGFGQLEVLALQRTNITDAGLTVIRKLPRLKRLYLPDKTTNNGLVALGSLPRLEELSLGQTQIDDAGLAVLKQFPNLQTLRIYTNGPGIKGPGLAYLHDLPHLKNLELSLKEFDDSASVHVKNVKALTKLEVISTNFTDAGMRNLADLENLTELTLPASITDAGLPHISNLTRLTQLNMRGTRVTDAGMSNLARLHALRSLDLNETKITDESFKYLEQMPALESLRVNEKMITDAGLAHLKGLSSLQNLNLRASQITDAGMPNLAGLGNLTSLSVPASVTDAGLAYLKNLHKLTWLYMEGAHITDKGIANVAGLHQLQTLNLEKTLMTDAGLAYLKPLSSLQALILDGTKITDAGCDRLAQMTALKTLSLKDTEITTGGATRIKRALPRAQIILSSNPKEKKLAASAPTDTQTTSGSRTIHFPADRSLGSISAHDSTGNTFANPVLAQGDVTFPAHLELRLATTKHSLPLLPFIFKDNELRVITLNGTGFTAADLAPLAQIRGLKMINFPGLISAYYSGTLHDGGDGQADASKEPAISAEVFKALQALPDLEMLGINAPFEEDGLNYLTAVPNLKGVNLLGSKANDSACAYLQKVEQLEELSLEHTNITDAGLAQLSKLPHLKQIGLPGKTTNKGLAALTGLPRLEKLSLQQTEVDNDGLASLKQFPNLQSLTISTLRTPDNIPTITGAGLPHLRDLPRLKEIVLDLKDLDDAAAQNLKGLKPLKRLSIATTNFSDAGMPNLVGLENLKQLTLPASITDAGLEHIKNLTQLTWLYLPGAPITDSGMAYLEGLHELQFLNLEKTQITDEGLKYLAQMPALKQLWLRETSITDAGLEYLKPLSSLQVLSLDGTKITDAAINQITQMSALKILTLNQTQITPDGALKLNAALPNCRMSSSPPRQKESASVSPKNSTSATTSSQFLIEAKFIDLDTTLSHATGVKTNLSKALGVVENQFFTKDASGQFHEAGSSGINILTAQQQKQFEKLITAGKIRLYNTPDFHVLVNKPAEYFVGSKIPIKKHNAISYEDVGDKLSIEMAAADAGDIQIKELKLMASTYDTKNQNIMKKELQLTLLLKSEQAVLMTNPLNPDKYVLIAAKKIE